MEQVQSIHMNMTKEEAIRQLRYATITLDYDAVTWDRYKSASYEFDFSELTWTREMVNIFNLKTTGEIPEDLAENFFERVWFVVGLPKETDYWTESERVVPATDKERAFLESDTKRLAQFRSCIGDKYFRWLPDVDTSAPYGRLTAAFTEFLTSLDI